MALSCARGEDTAIASSPVKTPETDFMSAPSLHYVNGNTIVEPFPEKLEQAVFGMGCFWGAERRFWETPGVY